MKVCLSFALSLVLLSACKTRDQNEGTETQAGGDAALIAATNQRLLRVQSETASYIDSKISSLQSQGRFCLQLL
jgi:hypothetical protein